jgi:hypothetical protein
LSGREQLHHNHAETASNAIAAIISAKVKPRFFIIGLTPSPPLRSKSIAPLPESPGIGTPHGTRHSQVTLSNIDLTWIRSSSILARSLAMSGVTPDPFR